MFAITIIQSQASVEDVVKANFLVTAKTEGQSLSIWFQEKLNYISYTAQFPEIQSMNADQYAPVLDRAVNEMPSFGLLYLIGTDGKQIYKTDNSTLGDVSDRDYFRRAMQGEKLISDPVVSKTNGKLLIPVASPVKDDDGKVVGVLVGSLSLDSISTLLKSMQFGETDEIVLFNEEGYFLNASRFEDQLKAAGIIKERSELEIQSKTSAIKDAINGKSQSGIYKDYLGNQVVAAYAPVQAANHNWAIGIKRNTSEVFAGINQQRKYIDRYVDRNGCYHHRGLHSCTSAAWCHTLNIIVHAGNLLSIGDSDLSGD